MEIKIKKTTNPRGNVYRVSDTLGTAVEVTVHDETFEVRTGGDLRVLVGPTPLTLRGDYTAAPTPEPIGTPTMQFVYSAELPVTNETRRAAHDKIVAMLAAFYESTCNPEQRFRNRFAEAEGNLEDINADLGNLVTEREQARDEAIAAERELLAHEASTSGAATAPVVVGRLEARIMLERAAEKAGRSYDDVAAEWAAGTLVEPGLRDLWLIWATDPEGPADVEPANEGGWFNSLGKPVPAARRAATVELLEREGYNMGEGHMVLDVVCREIEHDNPDRAQRYLRSWLGNNETMVMRVCATLCS